MEVESHNMPTESTRNWEDRYQENQIGWDIGYPSTPLKEYIDQLKDKNQFMLIPGCGHAYEGEQLHNQGFTNVYLSDLAPTAKTNFLKRVPGFPENRFIIGDFFKIDQKFDLIIEQTFYCALPTNMRDDYVQKMHDLLNPGGKLVGLLFTFPLTEEGPPFGGSIEEYEKRFSGHFKFKVLETAHNSIPPRSGNEAFFIAEKR